MTRAVEIAQQTVACLAAEVVFAATYAPSETAAIARWLLCSLQRSL